MNDHQGIIELLKTPEEEILLAFKLVILKPSPENVFPDIVSGNWAVFNFPDVIYVAFKLVIPEPIPEKLVTEISAGN